MRAPGPGRAKGATRIGRAALLASAALAAAGCHDPAAARVPDPDAYDTIAGQPCSELAGSVHGWLGKGTTCPGGPDLRELLAIGDGFLFDWAVRAQEGRIWSVGSSPPLGKAAIAGGPSPTLMASTTIVPIGKRRVLLTQENRTDVTLYTVNVAAAPGTDPFLSSVGESVFDDVFTGHGIVGLEDDYFLVWRTGTGQYNVRRVHEEARNTPQVIELTDFRGTFEALRRGARIVNLGHHRLLEWVPVTHRYRIWTYAFDPARPDIFDPTPVAEGTFPDLTARHEILVVSQDRVVVFERPTGHVQLRVFDPDSSNPLGGAIVSEDDYPALKSPDWKAPVHSAIENLVLILQDGRSFDAYFGQACRAPAGSNPTCEQGFDCCEGMPASIPGAAACVPLDPSKDVHVPAADFACMQAKYASADFSAAPCAMPGDFACTPPGAAAGAAAFFHGAAETGALADRYFQSTLDGTEPNLIYLAKTAFGRSVPFEFGLQLTRIMAERFVRWGLYLENGAEAPNVPPPVFFDHHFDFFRGIPEIARDVEFEMLPEIAIVLPGASQSELPGAGPAEVGIRMVQDTVERIAASPVYAPKTLVLVVFLGSGGFYDHVAPPPPVPIQYDSRDGQPVAYGPRVPFLALGRFARPGHVSHVQLENSSVAKLMEWNWLGGETGQLGHRDKLVPNLGSLLDATATGTPVP